MRTYGSSSHEENVEEYPVYKQNQFELRKGDVKNVVSNVISSSLKDDDKDTLLRELVDEINSVRFLTLKYKKLYI
jgi:hypothetical protein